MYMSVAAIGRLRTQAKMISGTIVKEISKSMGIELDLEVGTTEGFRGHYGAVGMRMEPRQEMNQEMRLHLSFQEHFAPELTIEEGETQEYLETAMHFLNFLVHHEVAHVIQDQVFLSRPSVPSFGIAVQGDVDSMANEVMMDSMAFYFAEKIYVYQGPELGDISDLSGAQIAVNSYLAIVNHLLGHFSEIPPLLLVRLMAVSFGLNLKTDDSRLYNLGADISDRVRGMGMDRISLRYMEIFNRQAGLPPL